MLFRSVITQNGDRIQGMGVILATGHSARDIFELLHRRQVLIEAKPFALGVRIEHPQNLIDRIQYHCAVDRGPYLPASAYALVQQTTYQGKQRGVFSFCMCPGGFIVPAATAPGELVVNGMSPSRRDSRFANSGMVVSVELEDLPEYQKYGPLAALHFQAVVEQRAWEQGGKSQVAPAQRMVDFVNKKVSSSLLDTSYQPGLAAVEMREVLPDFISARLAMAFESFGQKMKGYLTNEAQLIGVESRTSSPLRIPRDKESFEHPQLKHDGMVVEMTHPVAGNIRVLNNPLRMSANPASVRTPPPLLGEHTEAVLRQLGYDAAGVARLRAEGII